MIWDWCLFCWGYRKHSVGRDGANNETITCGKCSRTSAVVSQGV